MKWFTAITLLLVGLVSMASSAQLQPKVIWEPQEGSQELFLSCPIFECLYEGTRGPGKTDALLMDFAQHVGRGYGAAWTGVLFRKEYKELQDVVKKSKKWFRQIFPKARFLESKSDYKWVFPTGEELFFRAAKTEDDYWDYHGHEYPWIGFEELTNWANDGLYLSMFSVCRSSQPDMPRHIRATCNPYGVGHNWVKDRFIDPAPRGKVIQDDDGRQRVCLHGSIWENKILLKSDPEYLKNLQAQTGAKRAAWLEGSWDIVAGGMFDDVWQPNTHILTPFEIPASWKIDRSFDWGSSKPYSVGFWAESDGCDVVLSDGTKIHTVKGDLFRIGELYGCSGKANQGVKKLAKDVAKEIKKYEQEVLKRKAYAGPADSAIYTRDDGNCTADNMSREGVYWTKSNKGPGSRVNGWEIMRTYLKGAIVTDSPREDKGLFVFSTCRDFIRTVPVLPRDTKNMDDIDCFVAGTEVDTKTGLKNIEDIEQGEMVHTPFGYRQVLRAGVSGKSQTVKVEFSDGRTIEGTPDHKINIEGLGLLPLSELTKGMEVELTSWQCKKEFTAESSIESMTAGDILSVVFAMLCDLETIFCTGGCTEMLMEQFRQNTTSTISMAIQATMKLKTLNASKAHGIASCITRKEKNNCAGLTSNGLERLRASLYCVRMLKKCIKTRPNANLRALCVESNLELSVRENITVLKLALLSLDEKEVLKKYVRYAERLFSVNQIPRKKTKLAVTNVVGGCEEKEVYNLTTKQAHLYYVNGILVSNTEAEDHIADEVRYRLTVKKHSMTSDSMG